MLHNFSITLHKMSDTNIVVFCPCERGEDLPRCQMIYTQIKAMHSKFNFRNFLFINSFKMFKISHVFWFSKFSGSRFLMFSNINLHSFLIHKFKCSRFIIDSNTPLLSHKFMHIFSAHVHEYLGYLHLFILT